MSENDPEMWGKIYTDTTGRMSAHLQPYLSPISRVLSENEGEHLGSGAYFESEQKKYLITNEHVIKHRQNNQLTHGFLGCDNLLRLSNPAPAFPHPIDVAISRISESSWAMFKHSASAIPIGRFSQRHEPVYRELLFFAGYSDERAKFLFGNLITRATPYLTQECEFPANVPDGIQDFHFALFYKPDLATSVDGTSHLPNPHGFSGSLVWDTKRVACLQQGMEWSPEMAKVTGIVWAWPSSAACILATKVEHLNLGKLMSRADTDS